MKIVERMKDRMREGIRSFLQIQPATGQTIVITENMDYDANAIKNRIWYRGDAREINQLYHQVGDNSLQCFWSAVPTIGRELRKIHTGLPGIIVDSFVNIIMTEYNDITIDAKYEDVWKAIDKENKLKELIGKIVKDCLIVGDGAVKLSYDSQISEYPIIEWIPGEQVEFTYERGRFREAVFKSYHKVGMKRLELQEVYGFGYVEYHLYDREREIPLTMLENGADLVNIQFDKTICLAVPMKIFDSDKYDNRGRSIFDNKTEDFDALDESWSQWMQALREGRPTKYIPESLLPRNPEDGTLLRANAFDNQYIGTDAALGEGQQQKIELEQPNIPHDSYLSTYITALDLCLQGLISPSTLGIDVKKLDNAEAQREKEKTTLYTRGKIIDMLQEKIPEVVNNVFKMMAILQNAPIEEIEASLEFGEYANPSFESQIETLGKGKTDGIMSNEAIVDELYGDTKDEEWKKEEIARLNRNDGFETEETAAGDDLILMQDLQNGGDHDESKGSEQGMENVNQGV